MRFVLWVLPLSTVLLVGCIANPFKHPVVVSQSSRTTAGNCTAVLTRFDLSDGDAQQVRAHRDAATAAIFNSGVFNGVYQDALPEGSDAIPIFVDVAVRHEDEGGFNWWLSWPAIYPAPLYWPFQFKSGDAVVEIAAHAQREGSEVRSVKVTRKNSYSMSIYAFFRAGPIEDSFRRAFEGGYDQLASEIRRSLEDTPFLEGCALSDEEDVIEPGAEGTPSTGEPDAGKGDSSPEL